MYVRIKTRKTSSGKIHKYAYLVSSKRRRKSKRPPKQKVIAYLGKVIQLEYNHEPILNTSLKQPRKAIEDLLIQILTTSGFKKHSQDSRILEKDQIQVNLRNLTTASKNNKKPLCLAINEGFISSPTLKKLLNYKVPQKKETDIGFDLAKKLISCGIKPKKDDFVSLYNLIFHRK